jgi:membrane-bound serine protease (ClpP class)
MLAAMDLILTLLILGGVLLLLETVLPGLIAGVIGGCCLLVGIVLAYARFGAETGTWILLGTVGALVAGFCLWIRFFPTTRLGRRIMLKGVSGNMRNEHPELLQQMGTAVTQLRPSGAALINGRRVDVVSEGQLIEKGTPIKVVAIEGLRVVVRAAP